MASTFFKHSDLPSTHSKNLNSSVSSSPSSGPSSQEPTAKGYQAWNYKGSCSCDSTASNYATHHHIVVDFLQFGRPLNYTSSVLPQPTHTNHQSALAYPEDVQHYLSTELSFGALAGPFKENPLPDDLITFPSQTVYKCGSTKRRVCDGS